MFKKALYIICGTCIATSAFASGYQVSEYSATGIGRAFAGAGVVGDDFSAIGYNPAGMSYNKTNGAQLGAAAVILHSDWKDNTPGGTGVKGASKMARVLPNFFTQYRFNEDLTIGLGAYAPYGLLTDYDNEKWPQGKHGIYSGMKAVDLSGGASYKLHPMLSLGAALNAQYIDARLTSTGKDLDGHDVALGYSVGMTVTPREDIRLGVSYRSKVSHDLHGGKLKTGMGSTPIHAKITTPEYVLFSGAYDVNKQWTLSASARWTRWSRFENLNIMTKKHSWFILLELLFPLLMKIGKMHGSSLWVPTIKLTKIGLSDSVALMMKQLLNLLNTELFVCRMDAEYLLHWEHLT